MVAADRKKQLLEENLNRVSSKLLARTDEVWTQAERKDMARRFADSLCTCAEAMSTPEATCIDILGKLKLDFFDDEWFQGKFLRHLLEKVISEGNRDKEAEIQAEEDIMMYPVKPPEFLKHLFLPCTLWRKSTRRRKGVMSFLKDSMSSCQIRLTGKSQGPRGPDQSCGQNDGEA